VNIKMNDFVGNILENTFYAYCYILQSGTRRCTSMCDAAMLLMVPLVPKYRCCFLRTALNSTHPIHTADWYYTRNSSCTVVYGKWCFVYMCSAVEIAWLAQNFQHSSTRV